MDLHAYAIAICYLAAFASAAFAVSVFLHPVRQRRHAWLGVSIALGGVGFWLWAFNSEVPEYTTMASSDAQFVANVALILLLLVNGLVLNYFSGRTVTMRVQLRSLVRLALVSLFVSCMLTVGGVAIITGEQFWLALGATFSGLIFCGVVFRLLASGIDRGFHHDFLALLPARSITVQEYLRDLGRSGRFGHLAYLSKDEVEALDAANIYHVLNNDEVFTRPFVERQLKLTRRTGAFGPGPSSGSKPVSDEGDAATADQFRILLELLDQRKAWAVARVGGRADLVLASPVALSSLKKFEMLLLVVARTLAVLSTPPRIVTFEPKPFATVVSNSSKQPAEIEN